MHAKVAGTQKKSEILRQRLVVSAAWALVASSSAKYPPAAEPLANLRDAILPIRVTVRA